MDHPAGGPLVSSLWGPYTEGIDYYPRGLCVCVFLCRVLDWIENNRLFNVNHSTLAHLCRQSPLWYSHFYRHVIYIYNIIQDKVFTNWRLQFTIKTYIDSRLFKLNHIHTTVVREHKEFYYGIIHLKRKVTLKYISDNLPDYFTFYKIIAEEVFTNWRLQFTIKTYIDI